MNLVFAVIYVAALAALLATSLLNARERKRKGNPVSLSAWGWLTPSAVMLLFLAIWCAMGMIEIWNTVLAIPLTALAIGASGWIAFRREAVWAFYSNRPKKTQRALRIALVLIIVLLAFLIIEVPFNDHLPFKGPSYFWLEMILAGLLLLGLYFAGQRHAVACTAGVALFFFAGMGQYFIKRFKNAAILPGDLLVLNTAAAVGKEYVFSLNERAIEGLACAALCIATLALVRPPHANANAQENKHAALRNVGCAVGSFALLVALVLVPSYMNVFGVNMKYWYSIDYYQMQGFFPSFIAVLQDMPIHKPEGYSKGEAQKLLDKYTNAYYEESSKDGARQEAMKQFDEIQPTVIVVMNESFADLSLFDGMHAGYEGPQFFKTGLYDALERGNLNVTVHGAGTCNTEFEFLTGNSLSFIGVGKYPYSVYDLSDVDALAAQFKELGYRTCAIHPNYATNWNRDKIYAQMGFDLYLSIDSFGGTPNCAIDKVTPEEPHCEVFHSGVSDKETYDCMLRMIEESDEPQFFFDVTMANHGSYNQNNIPAEYQTNYIPADYDGEETPERLNEYLACIQKSDDDLREFVGHLRELDRPVVLVFFGDHQPSLSASYNDYWYPDEPENVHARRAFSSEYVIWANYDVAGRDQSGTDDETSVDMLAAITLDLIGAPVSKYQAAQLEIRKLIPSLSASDYQGNDRQWYVPSTTNAYSEAYHDLSLIEYLNFATKV